PRAVASRTSVNARTWSTTAVPQVSLADEGWEDVVAPIDELRLGRSSSVAAPAAGPPLLVSGPPTIVNTAPPVAADAPLSMPPAASFLPERARDDGALPPELAAPSHGFDDVDSDAARATPAQRWRVPAEAEEDIFDEPTDTGAGSPALAAAVAAVAPTMIAAAPTVIAATPSVVPVPSTAPGVEPSVHDARTAVEVPNDAVIDRFGHGRGAALLLIVGGFAVTLLATRAERSARDEAPSALAVVDAGPVVVDAGAVVVDAGAVVVDAGAVVVDAGSVEVDAATGAGGDEGKVDSRDAPPSPYDRELKRAEAFARRGDFGRAVRAYKAALAERSDGVTAHLGLGAAYYELDNLTAAMLHLERARVLDPQDPQVYVLLGAVYQSAGRRGDAIKAYEKFLKLAPGGKMATDVRAILRDL
ncbi:MAG: tetratricopeptide repeat protein, partial [Deltaproteobacteria bacterium]|nr:tetratricopeptide repeat protein [Deltaproteobacteria bacterium]